MTSWVQNRGAYRAPRPSRAQLLDSDDVHALLAQWTQIQTEFVDHPRQAVRRADDLVTALVQQLTHMFADERADLEQDCSGVPDTARLRQGLHRYRSFFERLLAA